MKVKDLLKALLLKSANDAAAHRRTSPGLGGVRGRDERARRGLGLEDTSYANPIGLDDPANYSSARDLAALARLLLGNPRFADSSPPMAGARSAAAVA